MNVLAIAPHPDDESIGCGGALCLHADRGDHICVVFLTSGELGLKGMSNQQAWDIREAEARRACEVIGVANHHFLRIGDWSVGDDIDASANALRPILEAEAPNLIYLPHPNDDHPDHRAVLDVVRTAMPGQRSDCTLRAYEVWTPMSAFDEMEDITPVMARKMKAIRCHRSQLDVFHYDRAIRGLNRYRGELAGHVRYAEVFQVIQHPPAL